MICNICPRECNIDREVRKGFCGMGENPVVARAFLHMWEEPCISGTRGSGTVFFSGCNLKCIFCQNHEISHGGRGKEISVVELAQTFLSLRDKGAHNINLVTPTHFVPAIIDAIQLAKEGRCGWMQEMGNKGARVQEAESKGSWTREAESKDEWLWDAESKDEWLREMGNTGDRMLEAACKGSLVQETESKGDMIKETEGKGERRQVSGQPISSVDAEQGVFSSVSQLDTLTPSKVKPLDIPVVYNTNGYESLKTLRMLDGLIDSYLPDLKYISPEVSMEYSGAKDYFDRASEAVLEMYRQVGAPVFDENGMMKRGMIIRHLVLPGHVSETIRVLEWFAGNFPKDVHISLMSQYTPCHLACDHPVIGRSLTRHEYEKVVNKFAKLGFSGYMQERESASAQYIPDFNQIQF